MDVYCDYLIIRNILQKWNSEFVIWSGEKHTNLENFQFKDHNLSSHYFYCFFAWMPTSEYPRAIRVFQTSWKKMLGNQSEIDFLPPDWHFMGF